MKWLNAVIAQLVVLCLLAQPALADAPQIWGPYGAQQLNGGDILAKDGSIYPKAYEKSYTSNWPQLAGNWYSSAASSIAVTLDTTAADLPRATTTQFGLKILPVNTKTDYVYTTFKLDPADGAKKLKVQFDQNPLTGFVSSDLTLEVDSCTVAWTVAVNTAATCSGTSARLPLSTDASAVTSLPNLTGTYRTTFDSPAFASAPFILLKIAQVSTATHALVISDLIVGPGTVTQGAALSGWQTSTMTIGGSTSAPTKGTNSLDLFSWRREGDSIHMRYSYLQTGAGSAGSGTYLFPLPNGYTVNTSYNTTAAANGNAADINNFGPGNAYDGTNEYILTAYAYNSTNIALSLMTSITLTNTLGSAHVPLSNASARIAFDIVVPVNELAGSGTVNVAQNDIQYYSGVVQTAGTWNSSGTVTTVIGPAGSQMGNSTPSGTTVTYTFVPPTPIPVGATPVFQMSPDQIHWSPIPNPFGTGVMEGIKFDGTNYVGVGLAVTSTGTIQMTIGKYAYGGTGAWNGTFYFRIAVGLPGQAVGYGLASGNVGSSGLVSYEDSGTFTVALTGAYTSTQNPTIRYSRVGKTVTISWTQSTAPCSHALAISAAAGQWPLALRPSVAIQWAFPAYDNTGYPASVMGFVTVNTDGSMTITKSVDGGSYSATGNCGLLQHSASYVVN
jgi:hypothetical protein